MHRDKRLGLAMGVLIIAIVGAFFFRIKPTSHNRLPQLEDQARLDQAIAQLPVAPYLTGLEADNTPIVRSKPRPHFHQNPPQWQLAQDLDSDEQLAGRSTDDNRVNLPDPIQRDDNVSAQTVSHRKQITPAGQKSDELVENNDMPAIDVFAKEYAGDPALAPPRTYPKVRPYRVKQGDTLSQLAGKYLGSEAHFMEIYRINRDILNSPDDLQAGMLIRIPMRKRRLKNAGNVAAKGSRTSAAEPPASNLFETLPITISTNLKNSERKQSQQPPLVDQSQKSEKTFRSKHHLTIEGSQPLISSPRPRSLPAKTNLQIKKQPMKRPARKTPTLKPWPFSDKVRS